MSYNWATEVQVVRTGDLVLSRFLARDGEETRVHPQGSMSIVIVASGSVIQERSGRNVIRLNRADAVATPSGTDHRLRFAGDDCRMLCIRIPPPFEEHITNVLSVVSTPPALVARMELELRSCEPWRDIAVRGLILRLIACFAQAGDRGIRIARARRPARAIVDLRAARAADMLTSSFLSLERIARTCGFFDSSHLIRAFEVRYGVQPKVFREARERIR